MLYMLAWIDMLAQWGCDYVEFDNMDWAFDSYETYEINVDPAAAAAYNVALCDRVHELGMLCMAKSTREGAESFDGMTVESYSDDHPGVGGYRH
jgi:cysteinyl-tRNA synthetase